jgi:hypothetical protein
MLMCTLNDKKLLSQLCSVCLCFNLPITEMGNPYSLNEWVRRYRVNVL